MKRFMPVFPRFVAIFVVLASLANFGLAQSPRNSDSKLSAVRPEASVVSVTFSGIVTCADLNGLNASPFTHIVSDFEFKLDFGTPNGTFPFSAGPGREITGPQYPSRSITVFSSGSTVSSFSSQVPITAVILKIGHNSVVYPYAPFTTGDTNLVTGIQQSISHISFCYAEPTNPTAGDGSVSGRVLRSNGAGIANARITLIDPATGEARVTVTSPFGYYSLTDLEVGKFYSLYVAHKRYTFAVSSQALSLGDSIADVNFVANQ